MVPSSLTPRLGGVDIEKEEEDSLQTPLRRRRRRCCHCTFVFSLPLRAHPSVSEAAAIFYFTRRNFISLPGGAQFPQRRNIKKTGYRYFSTKMSQGGIGGA